MSWLDGMVFGLRRVLAGGAEATIRSGVNFSDSAVTATDNAFEDRTDVSIATATEGQPGFMSTTDRQGFELNVKELGAVGNGIVDDTAALQAAIDYCSSAPYTIRKARVFLPAGSYKITSPLRLRKTKPIMMRGEGSSRTRITSALATTLIGLDDPTSNLTTASFENIDFESTRAAGILATFTTNLTADVFTATSHGLVNGLWVTVENSGGALPVGLTANYIYYVVNVTTNTFQLSPTVGGTPVDVSSAGTGTNKVRADVICIDATGMQECIFQSIGMTNVAASAIGLYMDSRSGGTNVNRFYNFSVLCAHATSRVALLTTKGSDADVSSYGRGPNGNYFEHWHGQVSGYGWVVEAGQGNVFNAPVFEGLISHHYKFGNGPFVGSGIYAVENKVKDNYTEGSGTSYIALFQTGAFRNQVDCAGITSVLGTVDPASVTTNDNTFRSNGAVVWGPNTFDKAWPYPVLSQVTKTTDSATGYKMMVIGQTCSGTSTTGAELALESGNGTLAHGAVALRIGGKWHNGAYTQGATALRVFQGASPSYTHQFEWSDVGSHVVRLDSFDFDGACTQVWGRFITSFAVSQTDETTTAATGASYTWTAQNSAGSGATVGGWLLFAGGRGATPGGVALQHGTTGGAASTKLATATHGVTLTGQLNAPRTVDTYAATTALDFAASQNHQVTLTGDVTFTFSNLKDGARYTIIVKQDGTGTRLATWPATAKFVGTDGTLSTAASATDVYTGLCDGTNVYFTVRKGY